MEKFRQVILSLCVILFSSAGFADDLIIDKSTGKSFPREISFEAKDKKYDLQATGVATRKKLIIKVYSIASYLQKGAANPSSDKLRVILSDDNAKQLTLKWARDVNSSQIRSAFEESLHKVFPNPQYTQQQQPINDFLALFTTGAKGGDEYALRWTPGGDVAVLSNGKLLGTIVGNATFAKGLWQIWFGDKSVVDRDALLSQLK